MVNFLTTTLLVTSTIYNGEESVELTYPASKMIMYSPMASVLTPVKDVSEQDRYLHNGTKAKTKVLLRTRRDIAGWIWLRVK